LHGTGGSETPFFWHLKSLIKPYKPPLYHEKALVMEFLNSPHGASLSVECIGWLKEDGPSPFSARQRVLLVKECLNQVILLYMAVENSMFLCTIHSSIKNW
jgi:hypothetical protein